MPIGNGACNADVHCNVVNSEATHHVSASRLEMAMGGALSRLHVAHTPTRAWCCYAYRKRGGLRRME